MDYKWRDGFVNMDGDDIYVSIPNQPFTDVFAADLETHANPKWYLYGNDPDDPRLEFAWRQEWGVEERYWGHDYVMIRYSTIWWEIEFWPIEKELYDWFMHEGQLAAHRAPPPPRAAVG